MKGHGIGLKKAKENHMFPFSILFVFGTRPEAIKLAPVIKEFKNDKKFKVTVCITAQHREMLDEVLCFFNIKPDYDLNIMKKNQTLSNITSNVLTGLDSVLKTVNPDTIFIQGDTTTAFAGALAGFYHKVKIVHIEAGLRSYNKYSPFPEEINRVLTGHIADIHFAPTKQSVQNLKKENIKQQVFNVGNTVIDALHFGLKLIKQNKDKYRNHFDFLDFNKKIILVTGHRRENFGKDFENIYKALKEIALNHKNTVEIVYPVHLNPNIQKPVKKILGKIENVYLIKPLEYSYLLYLMDRSYMVLTDSGGLQEEAPFLGKPVLVMRNVTERIEGIKNGSAKLVGTDKRRIIQEAEKLLTDDKIYEKMTKTTNLYGDGKAAKRIKSIILKTFYK